MDAVASRIFRNVSFIFLMHGKNKMLVLKVWLPLSTPIKNHNTKNINGQKAL